MVASSTTRKPRLLLWVVALSMAALAVWFMLRRAAQDVVTVRVAEATRSDLVATISTNGVTEPVTDFQAHSPIATVVNKVYVKEGDRVPAGKLLLTLDDSAARADLARATAAVSSARADVEIVNLGGTREERMQISSQANSAKSTQAAAENNLATLKALAAQGAASPAEVAAAQQRLDSAKNATTLQQGRATQRFASTDVAKARATLADAEAQVASAQQTLAKLNVRTPIAGTVYSLPVFATDYVQAGDKLAGVTDLSHVRVRAYFDEPEIGKLKAGQPVTIVWAARPGTTWHGHVEDMPSSIVHYGTRNVGEVVISVEDTDGSLLPQTNVTVTVTTFNGGDVLQVPREALHLDSSGSYVYLLQGDRAVQRNITTGSVNMVAAQVLSGLNSGDSVILGSVNGQPITNNTRVRATP